MNFKNEVVKLLHENIELEREEIEKLVESPKDEKNGEFAFPCFSLAKKFKKAPNLIAKDIKEKLNSDLFVSIENVNGYVNFKIKEEILLKDTIENVLKLKDDYGKTDIGKNEKMVVEYSSVNIAKVMHVGHIRSAMIGNSISRILNFLNFDVVRVNHLGDYGTQFGKMIVAFKKWGDREVIEKNPVDELVKLYVRFHDEADKDDSLNDEARLWFLKLENNDSEAVELWQWMKDFSMVEFERVYKLLDVEFDSYAGESFYSDKMPAVLKELREKNILKKDEGAEIVDLSEYNMPPSLVTKSDGSSLYVTRDIAASIYRKKTYDFYKNIYVVGSPQQLHFKQWMKIVELMGYDWAKDCVHVMFGTVSMPEGKMSTREGRVVKLEDVLLDAINRIKNIIAEKNPNLKNKDEVAKEVGVGAVVFQELFNNRIKDYTFNSDKMLSTEGETGPYVQYTHARACSILKNNDVDVENIDYSLIKDENSMSLVRRINKFDEVVIESYQKYEPSIITRYVCNLAKTFNSFYNENRVLTDNKELTNARLALVKATKITIKNALYLLTIKAPEEL